MSDPTGALPTDNPALPSRGWYRDPEIPTGDRWWDGAAWTEHRRPHQDAPVAVPPAAAPLIYAPVAAPLAQVSYTPGYGYPAGYTGPPINNNLAIVAFIIAVVSLPTIPTGFSFFGIVLGLTGGGMGLGALARSGRLIVGGAGGKYRRGLSIAAVAIGFGGAVVALGYTVVFLAQVTGAI